MVDTITSSIGTNARDYSTMVAWEADKQGDLVADDEIQLGECYNDSIFSERLLINGSTTDGTRYMHLTAAAGEEHNGTEFTGVRNVDDNGNLALTELWDEFIRIEKIVLRNTDVGNQADCLSINDNDCFINRMILADASGASGLKVAAAGLTTCRNSMVYNCAIGFDSALNLGTVIIVWDNNTAWNNGTSGFNFEAQPVTTCRNNAAMDNGTDFVGTADTASNNMSSDATALGGSSLINKLSNDNFINTGPGTENLHLKTCCADATGAGVDLSGTFTDDIDGDTRPQNGAFDIGADELLAGVSERVRPLPNSGRIRPLPSTDRIRQVTT